MKHISYILSLTVLAIIMPISVFAQKYTVKGRVVSNTNEPIPFATVMLSELSLWSTTSENGDFEIKDVPHGYALLETQCLGYVKSEIPIEIQCDIDTISIILTEKNLKLKEVVVTAKSDNKTPYSAYTIGDDALDHSMILSVGNIQELLPGGKTIGTPSLISDSRIAIHSNSSSELGNPSFGTAIEVDGIRIANNANMDETTGASTRNISIINIESIEVVTGIPSAEYGDLSNGIVKINTKNGKTPLEIELSTTQHTKLTAINKGFEIHHNGGTLNASFEHAKSIQDPASPYTSYQRNAIDIKYCNTFLKSSSPIKLTVSLCSNAGGFNSKADPDAFSLNYTKKYDRALRTSIMANWLPNLNWITNICAGITLSTANQSNETSTSTNSSSPSANIHATTEGYYIAENYNPENPNAPIILGPTGYWNVLKYYDSKPLDIAATLKYELTHRFETLTNRATIGAQFSTSSNNGDGISYDDIRSAPTWRPYRFYDLSSINNTAIYAENITDIMLGYTHGASIQLTAGIREDITAIAGSEYGTVSSVSPRINAKYTAWNNKKRQFSCLQMRIGFGKCVKLPSFQVLYPLPEYYDVPVFASLSSANNTSFAAYYTLPFSPIINKQLKWQHSIQTEVGIEATIKNVKIMVSGYYNKTMRPYSSTNIYTPFTYHKTPVPDIDACNIAPENRIYSINQQSGQITISDASMQNPSLLLSTTDINTYQKNTSYTNANPIVRYGIDWTIDFPMIKSIGTTIKLDGKYYKYKGFNSTILPYWTNHTVSASNDNTNNLIGYYAGAYSPFNGSIRRQINQNLTFATHITKARLIVSIKVEATLYQYSRNIIDGSGYGIAYITNNDGNTIPYNSSMRDVYVNVYPLYYSQWNNPDVLIPFAEMYQWAQNNDATLYANLGKLVTSTSYSYMANPDKISPYFSANINVTKEIGKIAKICFYANNFFRNNNNVKSSKTGLKNALDETGYIPNFYYGISLKIKI